jgi:hypothetical protein
VNLSGATDNAINISKWLIPQGEQLFFKKPSSSLKVDITTNQRFYGEGSTVNYVITVSEAETGKKITTDSYVSIVATDENVYFGSIANSRKPPDLFEQLYLENDLQLPLSERFHTSDYIQSILQSTQGSRDVEFLLANQL